MKKIKFLSLFLLAALLITGLTSCKKEQQKDLLTVVKERGKVIVGVKYDSRPFGFVDQDQRLKGYDIDLANEIAKRILGKNNATEFQQVTSSNRIFSITSGAVDMVAATMTINEKRRQIVDFSDPYYIAGQAILVPNNSPIKNAKDLNGKRVVVVLGSTSERNIRELAPKAMIQGFRTYTDAFSALRSGRADALTTDDTILAGFLVEAPNFKILKERYTKEPYGIGFRKGIDTQTFQKAVNIALEDIKADGTLNKLRKKWMVNFTNN